MSLTTVLINVQVSFSHQNEDFGKQIVNDVNVICGYKVFQPYSIFKKHLKIGNQT